MPDREIEARGSPMSTAAADALSERSARRRDAAADARDTAADARDATADAAVLATRAQDRDLAATDRSAAVADRQDLAVRDAAALARDEAAARRDLAACTAGVSADPARDWAAAAADRAAAVADRVAASMRNLAALVRDDAAQARDLADAGITAHGLQTQAADDRLSSAGDRAAAASDRQDAAVDRSGAADNRARSYRDELTGAVMRSPGYDQLSHEVDRARRGEPLVVAFVDVDRLKWFNDSQGHAAGDNVLAQLGRALAQGLRSYDVVVRYGGDEFVCALPGTRRAEAEMRFATVAAMLAQLVAGASISVGLAELALGETLEQVVARADQDMYARRRRDAR